MVTKKEIRQFLIQHFALDQLNSLGSGKMGILSYIERVKCLQEDPLDICGNNVEIILKSRFSGCVSLWLDELLYADSQLVEGMDKEAAIYPMKDWSNFASVRERTAEGNIASLCYRGQEAALEKLGEVKKILLNSDIPISSSTLEMGKLGKSRWGSSNLATILLYQLWCQGDAIIAKRQGRRKFYRSTETFEHPIKFDTEKDFAKWRILRRLSGLGIYWQKNGAGWQGDFLNERKLIFDELVKSGEIVKIELEDLTEPLYLTSENFQKLCSQKPKKLNKLSFIAPLDNLIWDRAFVKAIFDFEYVWEVYKSVRQRVYGYYVLPILYGDKFIGRIEPSREKARENKLEIAKIWFEKPEFDCSKIHKKIAAELERFNENGKI